MLSVQNLCFNITAKDFHSKYSSHCHFNFAPGLSEHNVE